MKDFVFVTGNKNKVQWLETFLGQKVEHHSLDLLEVQSLDPEEVVKHKVTEAYKHLQKPVLIDDTSLSFAALGKLPGPLIKFFLQELGADGICNMLNNYSDRSATATVVYGLYDGQDYRSVTGSIEGAISSEPRGTFGHGWDPIFIPKGQTKTFGEMTEQEYTSYSPRQRAVAELKLFLSE